MWLKKIMLLMILILMPYNCVGAISTDEVSESLDLDRDNSLLLNYSYDDYDFDGVNVEVYYIASIDNDMQYHLVSDFSNYPVKINGIKTSDEWEIVEDTLESYIIADSIEADFSLTVDDNKVYVSGLNPGLYFVRTDRIDNDSYSLLFDSFIVSVPGIDESGSWNYDVSVYPKAEEFVLKYDKVNYSVIKEWIDDGLNRPSSVLVEIYKDGEFIYSHVLSADNNWMYQWEADDDGSVWTVVERNVREGYSVSILERENKFIIVNTDNDYEENNPQTFDNINLYFCLFVFSLMGIVVLTVLMFIKNKCVK